MRKLLFIALMLLLPLQAVWAMASSYCEHEQGSHDPHFGHHEGHHHDAAEEAVDVSADVTGDKAPSSAGDGDAGHCHAVGAALLNTDAIVMTPMDTAPARLSLRQNWRPPPVAPPERPQWASHA